jgi:hypothetical protein
VRRDKEIAGGSPTVARFVAWFIVAGIVAVVIAGVAVTLLGRRAGEREAIVDLRANTLNLAQLRIQPAVSNSLLEGNITAVTKVGAAVRHYVLDDSVARVKIWNKDGTIVYSDEARLIGTNQAPSTDEIATLGSGGVRSKISDPSEPENRFERSEGKLLEVEARILAPNRQPLRLEVYYRYDAVQTAGTHVWNRFAPFALGALGALAVVQIVIGSLLARRLRRRALTRPNESAVEPVGAEPEHVAPDVFPAPAPATEPEAETEVAAEPEVVDTPEIVGTPEVVGEPEPAAPPAVVVEAPVREPDPGTELINALSRLLARSNGGGIPNTLDTHNVHDTIPPAIAELLFRATEEALRNRDHSTPVTVRVSDRDHVATLDVIEAGANGHVDLGALTNLVADAGGRLLVDSAENGGTRVHVEVPLQ